MFKPVESLVVPVVDAFTGLQLSHPLPNSNGERVYKERVYGVSPLRTLWPEVSVVILDWNKAVEALEDQLNEDIKMAKRENQEVPDFREERYRRMLELVQQPVHHEGKDYFGWWGWGSAAKEHQTIGFDVDPGKVSGLLSSAEDGSRYLRTFLPSSLYGGCMLDSATVLVLPDRSKFKGHLVADGFGFIKRSIWEKARNPDGRPIRLGRGRQNYLQWMRYRWDRIKNEAIPLIMAHLKKIGSVNWVLQQLDSTAGGYKNELIEIEEDMLHHPYCKLSANTSIKKLMTEIGTTVPLETWVRIAIPTDVGSVVWEGDSKVICSRHPMDSWQSQTALKLNTQSVVYERELDFVKNLVVVQTTETSPTTAAKGLRGVLPDDVMGQYDIVCTEEDFKMLKQNIEAFRNGETKVEVIKDLVIAFTQEYAPGSCAAIEPELWKGQGGDYDGDMMFVTPCSSYPLIWQECASWAGRDHSWKIPKTANPPEERAKLLVDVFGSGVGFATNVVSTTFTRQPDDRQPVIEAMYKAGVLFEPTERDLDRWSNKVIKVMTDGFKRKVNMAAERAMLWKAQQAITTECGGTARWATWGQVPNRFGKGGSPAFVNGIPKFWDMLSESTLSYIGRDPDRRRDPQIRMHIPREQYGGTNAEIYRLVLPWIEEQYNEVAVALKTGETFSFLELIETYPASYYLDWAPKVKDEEILLGLKMAAEFAGQSRQVSWESSHETQHFKETWQQACDRWSKQFGSRQYAAYVLWRAAHHASISGNGAAAVFVGFPDIAMQIVKEKPGKREQQEIGVVALVAGARYNFIDGTMPERLGPVTVEVYEIPWRGELRQIVVLDEPVPGMLDKEHFPIGTFGMITKEPRNANRFYSIPENGSYVARFEINKSGKSHRAYLNPLSDELPDGVVLS